MAPAGDGVDAGDRGSPNGMTERQSGIPRIRDATSPNYSASIAQTKLSGPRGRSGITPSI